MTFTITLEAWVLVPVVTTISALICASNLTFIVDDGGKWRLWNRGPFRIGKDEVLLFVATWVWSTVPALLVAWLK